jgi:hypothetical protein
MPRRIDQHPDDMLSGCHIAPFERPFRSSLSHQLLTLSL